MRKAGILLILFTLVAYNAYHVILHEETHKGIFNDFGIKSEIHYGITSSYTQPEMYYDDECNQNCEIAKLQAQTEMMAYGIDMLFMTAIFCVLLSAIVREPE